MIAHPPSDPEERVYRTQDFRIADDTRVAPVPMYFGARFSAVTFTMLPGQVHEPHSHEDLTQAWFILEGTGEALLGGDRRERVEAGTVIVHHPGQVHGIVNVGSEPLVYVNISLKNV